MVRGCGGTGFVFTSVEWCPLKNIQKEHSDCGEDCVLFPCTAKQKVRENCGCRYSRVEEDSCWD